MRARKPRKQSAGGVFRKEGEYWTIAHHGDVFRLRDGKGLHYIVRLLGRPGKRLSLTELSGAVQERPSPEPSKGARERARQKITKAIRAAVARIAENDPSLGHHLATSIRTGTYCSYTPDPTAPVRWKLR